MRWYVAIRRLREKVEDEPASPKHIITKRGMGYYFAELSALLQSIPMGVSFCFVLCI